MLACLQSCYGLGVLVKLVVVFAGTALLAVLRCCNISHVVLHGSIILFKNDFRVSAASKLRFRLRCTLWQLCQH